MKFITSNNLRYLGSIADQCHIVIKRDDTDLAILSPILHLLDLILDSSLDALQSRNISDSLVGCF